MRSIIFTSLLSLLALPAAAAPEGCFARTYSDAHLANNPAQLVRSISMAFGDFAGDTTPWVDVQAEIADQGHARGTLKIEHLDATSLLVRMDYFTLTTGDDCGGDVDLTEVPGQSVAYKLERRPDAACAGRWQAWQCWI